MKKFDENQEGFLRKAIKSGLHEEQLPGPAFAERVMRELPVAGSPRFDIVMKIGRYQHFLWLLLIPLLGGLAFLLLLKSNFVAAYLPALIWLQPYAILLATALFYFQVLRVVVVLAFFGFNRPGNQTFV